MAKQKIRTLDSYNRGAFLYILPMLLMMIFFWIIPIIIAVFGSFSNYTGLNQPTFIGPENYVGIFTDKLFYDSLKVTALFVIGVVPIQTILAFLVAAWIDRKGSTPVSNFVRWTMFIPTLASTSVIGIICRVLLNNADSPLNTVLGVFGIEGNMLLGSASGAMIALIVIQILISSGYYMVIYLSALVTIPRSYYEAARLEGVSTPTIYRRITLPIVKPTTVMILFLGVLSAIQTFDLVYVMTGGGPQTATYTIMLYLYMYAFKYSKVAMGMAISVVLCVLVGLIVLWQRKTISAKESNLY
jgi:multiple sugar transport system permease protein